MLKKKEIIRIFDKFISQYDEKSKTKIWKQHSKTFRDFWNKRIMGNSGKVLNDSEIDHIIRMLDRHGRDNTKKDEAVGRIMIPQGAWCRMFKDIKKEQKLRNLLNKIFTEKDINSKAKLIDALYIVNEKRKNRLTGQSGNGVNTMLFAFSPSENVSVVSLKHRRSAIEYFDFMNSPDFDTDTVGTKIVLSNISIINGFRTLGINSTPRTISCFLYESNIKHYWKTERDPLTEDEREFPEGRQKQRAHFYRERNRKLIIKVKQKMLKNSDRLKCQVCDFVFSDKYGKIGKDYIEAHHLKPVSELTESGKTKIKDIALVCSNCHRMLHRKRPWLGMRKLKDLLKQ